MNDEAQYYNKQGLQLLHSDRLQEALDFFTKAIELDPAFSDAYHNRGETYRLLDRIIQGNADIEKAKDLRSGKLRSGKPDNSLITKLNMNEVDSIYDAVFPSGTDASENDPLVFDDDLYDYVFSDDTLETEAVWDGLIHDNTETLGFPAILEFLGGDRLEVAGALLFQPNENSVTITSDDGNVDRVLSLEQLACIRVAGIPPGCAKHKDKSCHVEIIETIDGNIYHESIHPEQEITNILLGFSTKAQTRFTYSLIPVMNIKRRCQQRYLGEILLEKRFIASDILKRALEEHKQTKSMKIGKILAQKANILYSSVEMELKKAYSNNIRGLKTGEILLAAGLVDEEQILDALEYQENLQNKKIGQFLIEKGILQEKEVYISLAEKFRIPFVDLREQKVSKKTLTLIPREMVLQYEVMPLSSENETLIVATTQPDTSSLCEVVLKQTKCQNVKFVLTQPSHLKNVISLLYKKMGMGN